MLVLGVIILALGVLAGGILWGVVDFMLGLLVMITSILFGIAFIWMGQTSDKLKEILRILKGEAPKKPGH